jgi:hypothetical protein
MPVWVVFSACAPVSARYASNAAQLKTNPDFLLMRHVIDSQNTVPADAERIEKSAV